MNQNNILNKENNPFLEKLKALLDLQLRFPRITNFYHVPKKVLRAKLCEILIYAFFLKKGMFV